MSRRIALAVLLTLLPAALALGVESTSHLLARAWPVSPGAPLSDVGRGIAIVFSPDLTVPGNCAFYQALGFSCFVDADWTRIVDAIRSHNTSYPERSIRTLILETHGTNGHGLRVQKSKSPKADRSYISVGALQERLELYGVRYIIIGACNSGRLLRPMIVRTLDSDPGDKLFLPATCGIVNASANWNPRRSRITVITPVKSNVEATLVGRLKELAPATRRDLLSAAKARGLKLPSEYAVSEMFIRILLRDETLELRSRGYVELLSKEISSVQDSEKLFRSFVNHLNAVAAGKAPARLAAVR